MSLIPHDLHPQRKCLPDPSNHKKIVGPSQHVLLGVFILFALFAFGGVTMINDYNARNNVASPSVAQNTSEVRIPSGDLSVYEKVSLEGESALVWEVGENRPLFTRNETTQRPLASLSKVMTALLAYEILGPDALVKVDSRDLLWDGLRAGEIWNVADLVDFMLVVSSNDAARVLATALNDDGNSESAFVDAMNNKANELGMLNTYFLNPSGLDVDEETLSGTYGTTEDIVILFNHILNEYPEIFAATTFDSVARSSQSGNRYSGDNTNDLVNSIPGLVASKTGFTDLAGGNLVVVFDAGIGQKYVIAVLGSSKEGRFSDVRALHKATMDFIHSK